MQDFIHKWSLKNMHLYKFKRVHGRYPDIHCKNNEYEYKLAEWYLKQKKNYEEHSGILGSNQILRDILKNVHVDNGLLVPAY